jgi:hypothetical protein
MTVFCGIQLKPNGQGMILLFFSVELAFAQTPTNCWDSTFGLFQFISCSVDPEPYIT